MSVWLSVGLPRPKKKPKEILMAAIALGADQEVPVNLKIVDIHGNPAPVDGTPAWSVSDPQILGVNVAPDGLSGVVYTLGKTGTAQVAVTADADLGAGVISIQGVLDVTVGAGQAALVTLEPGTPVPHPPTRGSKK